MISFDQAIEIIRSAARPLRTETVSLEHAAGRVLAGPVIAAITSPRADVSAMDGYAVRGADLSAFPITLQVIGESLPGGGWPGTVERGACVRIFTGAPLPQGADRVVIQERVRQDRDSAIIDFDAGPATWVRPRGKDFRVGDELLPVGRLLDPAALIAATGADVAEVDVFVRPRVALLSVGDELVEPGEARMAALAVPDSASLGVAALAEQWGGQVVSRARLHDDLAALETAATEAVASADMVVVIGGASVGERDFAKTMFEPLGFELLFSKVSIRPGKPAWFGCIGETPVLGLPGNPTSALVTARLLLAPLLAAMQGRPLEQALAWEPARLASPIPACDLRETFHRARLASGEVALVDFQESHAQKALAEADVLVRQPANSAAVPAGEDVQVLRL
ncbi:MAG: molybdopterin molybdotransferase [Sphingomonadales bacterium]|jgi:molybdopterin molybdotransferase|nr:molybdopterin molybdotransferase [Sphingomonadales bacterium]